MRLSKRQKQQHNGKKTVRKLKGGSKRRATMRGGDPKPRLTPQKQKALKEVRKTVKAAKVKTMGISRFLPSFLRSNKTQKKASQFTNIETKIQDLEKALNMTLETKQRHSDILEEIESEIENIKKNTDYASKKRDANNLLTNLEYSLFVVNSHLATPIPTLKDYFSDYNINTYKLYRLTEHINRAHEYKNELSGRVDKIKASLSSIKNSPPPPPPRRGALSQRAQSSSSSSPRPLTVVSGSAGKNTYGHLASRSLQLVTGKTGPHLYDMLNREQGANEDNNNNNVGPNPPRIVSSNRRKNLVVPAVTSGHIQTKSQAPTPPQQPVQQPTTIRSSMPLPVSGDQPQADTPETIIYVGTPGGVPKASVKPKDNALYAKVVPKATRKIAQESASSSTPLPLRMVNGPATTGYSGWHLTGPTATIANNTGVGNTTGASGLASLGMSDEEKSSGNQQSNSGLTPHPRKKVGFASTATVAFTHPINNRINHHRSHNWTSGWPNNIRYTKPGSKNTRKTNANTLIHLPDVGLSPGTAGARGTLPTRQTNGPTTGVHNINEEEEEEEEEEN